VFFKNLFPFKKQNNPQNQVLYLRFREQYAAENLSLLTWSETSNFQTKVFSHLQWLFGNTVCCKISTNVPSFHLKQGLSSGHLPQLVRIT